MVHAKQKQNENKNKKTQNRQKLCMPKQFLNLAGGNGCKHVLDLKVRVVHFGFQVI